MDADRYTRVRAASFTRSIAGPRRRGTHGGAGFRGDWTPYDACAPPRSTSNLWRVSARVRFDRSAWRGVL